MTLPKGPGLGPGQLAEGEAWVRERVMEGRRDRPPEGDPQGGSPGGGIYTRGQQGKTGPGEKGGWPMVGPKRFAVGALVCDICFEANNSF